jgi:hypothetical protein
VLQVLTSHGGAFQMTTGSGRGALEKVSGSESVFRGRRCCQCALHCDEERSLRAEVQRAE